MKSIAILASLLVSSVAFANDVDPNGFEKQHFTSSMSRAEVVAASKVKAPVSIRIDDQGRAITSPSSKTRAEVADEARRATHTYGEIGQASID